MCSLGVLKNNLRYFKRKSVLMAGVCVCVKGVTVNHLRGFDLDCIWEAYLWRSRRLYASFNSVWQVVKEEGLANC